MLLLKDREWKICDCGERFEVDISRETDRTRIFGVCRCGYVYRQTIMTYCHVHKRWLDNETIKQEECFGEGTYRICPNISIVDWD